MDIRQLRALLAVSDHGTFSAAADVLHTVQSNVSAHVARLEKELGATLVSRAGGHLTEEGQAVAARARRIVGEMDAVVTDLAALRDQVVGTVRIGMIGTTARWLVPQLLDLAAVRHPRLHLVTIDAGSATQEPNIRAGRLDLAVVMLPVSGPDLSFTPLFDEDLLLVVSVESPLSRRESIDLRELADLELLLPPAGTAFRDELDGACRPAGVVLRPRAELDGVRLIASLTFDGYGPAILPATAMPSDLRGLWRTVRVEGMPRRHVGVVQRASSVPSAPTGAVMAMLTELTFDSSNRPEGLHAPAVGSDAVHRVRRATRGGHLRYVAGSGHPGS
ncbi:MAG: LysR family transcriptional regulator [Acidimicrobiales bacterium]|nr:LysR family transcriptional regulator [Acidimicrobiales bacterium]MBO0894485.1 LysR family transcriptional regulator [Acidimicrobiales bacterium]